MFDGAAALRDRLSEPASLRVAWLSLPSPAAAEMAGIAGAGAGVVDREHGAIGVETSADMIRALAASLTPALVRIPDLAGGAVAHALDQGAAGVVVPAVESAETAARAVALSRFPPAGRRGSALGIIRAGGFGGDPDYARRWQRDGMVVLQIETARGLAAADAIAGVEGVDMLFFGPFDYAADTGLDPASDGEALGEAFDRIVAAARNAGALTGVFPWPGAEVAALADRGADLIAAASDVATLTSAFRRAFA